MKLMTTFFKKAAIVPLVFISLSCFSQPTLKPLVAMVNNPAANIEFVKADKETLLFDVNLAGLPETGCRLKIYDASGEILFEKWINAPSYRKLYRIERNNSDKISFEAKGKDFRFNESFNLRFKLEEKLEVTKL
jgi:hypothetical protein